MKEGILLKINPHGLAMFYTQKGLVDRIFIKNNIEPEHTLRSKKKKDNGIIFMR